MREKIVGFDSKHSNLLFSSVKPKKDSDGSYSEQFSEEIVEDEKKSSNYDEASFQEETIEEINSEVAKSKITSMFQSSGGSNYEDDFVEEEIESEMPYVDVD